MKKLTMELCRQIISGVVQKAAADGGKPVAVAVCDQEGFLVGLLKMDGIPTRCVHFARHKAYTAARMQTTTAAFQDRLLEENLDIHFFCDPDLTPLPGGAPIYAEDGSVIGSVGISGRPSAEDQQLAVRAARLEF
ncbi:heme-binding protein [Sporomusa aerivorans]|uniref:GlcG/HbpS family heme-binding protein n=1 Tax=Sporomusa aerivorans TaxID=204936 RepID=UPI00352B370C